MAMTTHHFSRILCSIAVPPAATITLVATLVMLSLPQTAAAAAATSAAPGAYDPSLEGMIAPFDALVAATQGAGATQLPPTDLSTLPFYLSAFAVPSLDAQSATIASYVAGIVPLCAAYNAPVSKTLSFTVAAFNALLTGAAVDLFGDAPTSPEVVGSSTSFASIALPDAATGLGMALLASLQAAGATDFAASAASYPAAVTANGVVSFGSNETAAAEAVAAAPWRLTVVSWATAARLGLKCAKFRFAGTTYDNVLPAALQSTATTLYSVSHAPPSVQLIQPTAVAYPLVGPVVLYSSLSLACDGSLSAETRRAADAFYRSVTYLVPFSLSKVRGIPVSMATSYSARVSAITTLCSPVNQVVTGGSSALVSVMLPWVTAYEDVDSTGFINYASVGSGAGVSGAIGGQYLLGGSEAVLTAAQRAANPTLLMVPAVALAIAVVFNFPQQCLQLHLPRCTVVGIFNGSIKQWDDDAIQAVNPSMTLPSAPIEVLVRSDGSGSTAVFTSGLRALDIECNGASTIVPSKSWVFSNNVTLVAGTSGVIKALQSRYYTIGYVALPNALEAAVPYADLVDSNTGAVSGPSESSVAATLSSKAVVDPTTLELTLKVDTSAYVFVGATYLIFDTAKTNDCTAYTYAIRFLEWALTSDAAQSAARALHYSPIPTNLLASILSRLRTGATCNGAKVFPEAAQSTLMTTVAAAVAAPGALLLFVGVWRIKKMGQRDNDSAPKDPNKPLAMVFTDIQASTTLWSSVPEHMALALDAHNEVLRRVLAAHNGYEVKTIGDAFMIAFSSADDAVGFALEAQKALYYHDWGTDAIDNVYCEIIDTADQEGTPLDMWNGLRVRIGVHYGLCEIHEDQTTKGYDYHGTLVNTAARVEDAGHGGQIVVTDAVLENLSADAQRSLVVTPIGPTSLRGLLEDVHLSQVCAPMFVQRKFPPLRVDRNSLFDDEDANSSVCGSQSTTNSTSQLDAALNRAFPVLSVLEATFVPLPPKDRTTAVRALCTALRIHFKKHKDPATEASTNLRALGARVSDMVLVKESGGFKNMNMETSSRMSRRRSSAVMVLSHRGGDPAALYAPTTLTTQLSLQGPASVM